MKLSWKDIVTTAFALAGGAVVYAKFYDYSWALIDSWRVAVAALTLSGLGMFLFSRFDFSNMSWLNLGEMVLGALAIGLVITGMIIASETVFYAQAITLGVFWLVDTARHLRHSIIGDSTTSYHHQVPAH